MAQMPDHCVDLILCDLPYGTTQNKWDSVIPLEQLWNEYRRILKENNFSRELEPIVKWDFYDAVMSDDHVLTIQTADQATWANLLLSVGVRT